MKIDQVPQDRGMITDDQHEICYAVDKNGRYVLAQSAGWEPKNVANSQAWDFINMQVNQTLDEIKAGNLSPIAYHMTNNQMNENLLAAYMGFSRRRVKRHLKPKIFTKLGPEVLQQYAEVFQISLEALVKIPAMDSP